MGGMVIASVCSPFERSSNKNLTCGSLTSLPRIPRSREIRTSLYSTRQVTLLCSAKEESPEEGPPRSLRPREKHTRVPCGFCTTQSLLRLKPGCAIPWRTRSAARMHVKCIRDFSASPSPTPSARRTHRRRKDSAARAQTSSREFPRCWLRYSACSTGSKQQPTTPEVSGVGCSIPVWRVAEHRRALG